MFLHLSYQRYFWAVLGLASAAIWVLGRDEEEQPSQAETPLLSES
jgi:hypothetical protein